MSDQHSVSPAAQLVTACRPRTYLRVIAKSHTGVNNTATITGK